MKLNAKLYLKIIGILLVLTPFADIIFGGGAEAFMKGYNSVECEYETEFVNIIPKNNQTLIIPSIDGTITLHEANILLKTKEPLDIYPFYIWPIKLVFGFLNITFIILIILIIRRLISNRLLEKGTAKYIFYYSLNILLFSIIDNSLSYIKYHQLEKYFTQSNYTVAQINFFEAHDYVFILILFAFAIAVNESIKLKEENDLTI